MSKCTRINEFVEILDRPCVLNCCLNPLVKLALKLQTLFNYKMQEQEKIKNNGQYEREKRRKGGRWHLMRSKCTKQRGLPLVQQPRDVPLKVIRKSLPTIARYKKISRLLVTKGRQKIGDKTRLSILRYELIISKLLRLFQTIKVDDLFYREHVSISYGRPDYHTAYDNSPQIMHKLPRCKV